GVCLYLSKVSCHCASSRGGMAPTIGCHSTMESPECVSRVTPPTTTIAKTSAQQASSHHATGRRAGSNVVEEESIEVGFCPTSMGYAALRYFPAFSSCSSAHFQSSS